MDVLLTNVAYDIAIGEGLVKTSHKCHNHGFHNGIFLVTIDKRGKFICEILIK